MKRKIRTLENAKVMLEPYYEKIMQAMQKSFSQHLEVKEFIINNQGFFELKPRTKANLISDFIETNIIDTFNEMEGVTAGVFNNVFGLNINNEFFLRFKKMDRSFKTGNVKTLQQQSFQKQHTIIGFPDQPTFLFAGYVPDALWLNVTGFYIACWDGNSLEWFDEFGNISFEQLTIKFDEEDTKALQKVHEIVEKKIKLNSKIIQLKVDQNK